MSLVTVFVALLFLYTLASRRLERTVVTAPMVFTGAGIVVLLCLPPLRRPQGDIHVFLQLAEVGLVLLLFTDASRTDLRVLRSIRNLPLRLLTTGMLLTLLLGALGARLVFPALSLWEAGFTEEWGQALNLTVFFTFGMLVARDWRQFSVPVALYAVLSLTVVRMVPVAVALRGARLSRATVLFMGWFGPRGLASIVLGLVYLEETDRGGRPTIPLAVMATVLLSILAHGLSAVPGMAAYARSVAALEADAPEHDGTA